MEESQVTTREFEERLAALCLSGKRPDLPRKRRDRHILFISIAQTLEAGKPYSEQELNAALQEWLAHVGSSFDLDHVTLRRYLVDEGYLSRAASGTTYEVCFPARGGIEFEPDVLDVDQLAVLQAAQERAAARKREHSQRS
jgi:hypothetical protein